MEVVIQNYLLFKSATDVGGRAWALEGLQNLMQSLSSPFHLPDVLKKVAKNALLTLDADNVTLYQFHADKRTLDAPPATEGKFSALSSIRTEVSPDDVLLRLIQHGESQFVQNVKTHPILGKPSASGRIRFAEREGIGSCESCLQLQLDFPAPQSPWTPMVIGWLECFLKRSTIVFAMGSLLRRSTFVSLSERIIRRSSAFHWLGEYYIAYPKSPYFQRITPA